VSAAAPGLLLLERYGGQPWAWKAEVCCCCWGADGRIDYGLIVDAEAELVVVFNLWSWTLDGFEALSIVR